MGNTMRIDMGNSFEFISPVLRGHVKGTLGNGATADVCEVGFEGPTKHVAVVSEVQIQPQERLQVVETFRARRMPRPVRSQAPPAPVAHANEPPMVESTSTSESKPSQLGESQTADRIEQEISRSTHSCGSYDRQMVEANGPRPPRSSPFSARSPTKSWSPDGRWSQQPCLDGGFQRLVSHARWSSGRTLDGAGLVQSLCADDSNVARSKMGARAADLSKIIPPVRLSVGHPSGQRQSLWDHGSS